MVYLPMGSIVAPFWDYVIIGSQISTTQPQKGTSMEAMGNSKNGSRGGASGLRGPSVPRPFVEGHE